MSEQPEFTIHYVGRPHDEGTPVTYLYTTESDAADLPLDRVDRAVLRELVAVLSEALAEEVSR